MSRSTIQILSSPKPLGYEGTISATLGRGFDRHTSTTASSGAQQAACVANSKRENRRSRRLLPCNLRRSFAEIAKRAIHVSGDVPLQPSARILNEPLANSRRRGVRPITVKVLFDLGNSPSPCWLDKGLGRKRRLTGVVNFRTI